MVCFLCVRNKSESRLILPSLQDNGNVYSWGKAEGGRLGQETGNDAFGWDPAAAVPTPSIIDPLQRILITQIAVGVAHNLALAST